MRWYLSIEGQNYGPYDEAQILQMIQAGQVGNDWMAPDGGQEWVAVNSHPPFAQALATRGGAPQQPPLAAGGDQVGQGGQAAPVSEEDWLDLKKTIPFGDVSQHLADMQQLQASMRHEQAQPAPYQPPQAQPAPYQPLQAQPAPYQPPQAQPAPVQLAQAQPAPVQPDAAGQAPSDQPGAIMPPSLGKAIVIAAVALVAIIGVGVLLQILIGPGF